MPLPLSNRSRLQVPEGHPSWLGELGRRARRLVVLKALGITGFMWLFFALYFHLLRHPSGPVFRMPLTFLDHALPFRPEALWAYVSLWLYTSLPPALLLSLRELIGYGLWIGAMCLTGLGIFYLVPTAVPPMPLPVDIALHPGFALLQGVDASGNACPSLHVAAAAFSALWLARLLRDLQAPVWLRVFNGVWFLLIAWSTMATKQHVAWDVLAGLVLGAAFAVAALATRRA